jgi:hypothetical protein
VKESTTGLLRPLAPCRSGAAVLRGVAWGRAWVALVLLLLVVRCNGGIQEDDLECQEAASQLQNCCPGFNPKSLVCTYSTAICGTIEPDFSLEVSQCIIGESCEALRSTGVCARAEEFVATTQEGGVELEAGIDCGLDSSSSDAAGCGSRAICP